MPTISIWATTTFHATTSGLSAQPPPPNPSGCLRKGRHTPALAPVKTVAQSKGYYSPEEEKRLATEIEGPANLVLRRLRAGLAITSAEREAVVRYLGVMLKRVPYRRRKALERIPEVIQSVTDEYKRQATELGKQPGVEADAQRFIEDIEALRLRYLAEPPPALVARALAPEVSERILGVIRDMNWRLIEARGPRFFMTTDNPMFFFEGYGGGWRFGEAGAERRPSRRREIDAQLRRALERGEMAIEYEPMVESTTGRVLGLEALLRWNSAELGPVPPNEFIPFAEETGLIVPIGRWVFETACADLKRWQAAGHSGLFVSVNLSARQMREPDFIDMVKAGVAGLPPGAVELELTESMLIDSAGASRVALDEIRAAGVRISVDDFGPGYSSLAYLRSFPIDKLKVDRSFVRDIGLDPRVEAIVHIGD